MEVFQTMDESRIQACKRLTSTYIRNTQKGKQKSKYKQKGKCIRVHTLLTYRTDDRRRTTHKALTEEHALAPAHSRSQRMMC